MKKLLCALFVLALAGTSLQAQDAKESRKTPSVVFAPNLIGPIFGLYSGTVNFAAGEKMTIDTDLGYFNVRALPLIGASIQPGNELWFGYAKVGPTIYFDQAFHGWFLGGYVKGAYFNVSTPTEAFNAGSAGVGAKFGIRGTWDWFSMALSGGYEYNKAFAAITSSDPSISGNLGSVEGGNPFFNLEFAFAVY